MNHIEAEQNAVTEYVQHFGGDAVQALLRLADAYGVAVAYQTRESIDPDDELTDEQWEERVRPHLDGFDEFLDNSGAAESIDVWRFGLRDEAMHPRETPVG